MQFPEIVCVGHIVEEMVVRPDCAYGPVLGGPAAFSSAAGGKLQARVGLVTKVGRDACPDLLSVLRDASVDTEGVMVVGQESTKTSLVYGKDGSKHIEYRSKAPAIWYSDIPRSYLGAQVFFICPIDGEVSVRTAIDIRAGGSLLAVDLGGFGGAASQKHPAGSTVGLALLRRLVEQCWIVKASDEDCQHLFRDWEDSTTIAETLLTWGAPIAIITHGARGATVRTEDEAIAIPAARCDVVDPTGAGDVFGMVFVLRYMKTGNLRSAGAAAAAASSLLIERSGGVCYARLPSWEAIARRMRNQGAPIS